MAKKKDRTYDSLQNPFDGFDCFPKGEVENVKLMLMTFKIMFQKENTEGVDEKQTTAIKKES